jgi:N-methylhydantoinase A
MLTTIGAKDDRSMRYRVGIDIGGTFTDVILIGADGSQQSRKVLSTPDDYGRGIVAGLSQALAERGAGPEDVESIVHATTVATNAILERQGALTGLITTRGFRDVLDMRRLRIPEMYVLNYPKPEPLVPRRLRLEVDERLGPLGELRRELDEASVVRAAERLRAAGVEAVAISLLHAYANPEHEHRVAEILRRHLDGAFITCSSDILPLIREYERTSTTVINAYLGPILERYFHSLSRHLTAAGIQAPLQVMKSDGGTMSLAAATERPAYIVESGPAAGVIGAAEVAKMIGGPDCITLDMGGTTAKAAMVEEGRVDKTGDYEVGAGINLSSKLVMGGGFALKLPVIDISEIGAGGGSIVAVDAGGLMHVGPESAGADPGPVAYDRGGVDPTFSDAMVALGYLNPHHLVGGALALNAGKAREVLAERVAGPLQKELEETAYGVYQVAGSTMVRAVKAVSTYRGRDPRDFALFAFGGNGPVVAAEVARLMGMTEILVPPNPGVFSAFGLLLSAVEHETNRAYLKRLDELSADDLDSAYEPLLAELRRTMTVEGFGPEAVEILRFADLRYFGQAHELVLPNGGADSRSDLTALALAFGDEHERTYGHRAEDEAVECVALRVAGRVPPPPLGYDPLPAVAAERGSSGGNRTAYFGPDQGRLETPVLARCDLIGDERPGPLIVEEYDATCVVPPGWRARLDASANIVVTAEDE